MKCLTMSKCRAIAVGVLAMTAVNADASVETNSPVGINSASLPLTGKGISIGQVESERPGKFGFDDGNNSNFKTIPKEVFLGDGLVVNPTPNAFNEIFDVGPPSTAHATQVAGVMIGGDPVAPGVAVEADLYATAISALVVPPVGGGPFDIHNLSSQFIATRDNGNVRAINMSFLSPFEVNGVPDGNSPFTQFVDWSASEHDVLYVVRGRQESPPASLGQPADNFNGMTVASSTKEDGVYRRVAASTNILGDALGDRTSIDILAPGSNVEVADVGAPIPPTVTLGTSFATPHVVGTVALLQEHSVNRVNAGAANWGGVVASGPTAYRHEVSKAVLMNSADKFIDNGTVMFDGNVVAQGRLLGMERTVLKKDGISNWFDSDAFDDFAAGTGGGFFEDGIAVLDEEMGTGHLNAKRALQQFIPGEHEADGAAVPVIGWDYGSMSGTGDINKYAFDQQMTAGDFISITMAWDRKVEFDNDGGTIGKFDANDTFVKYTETDPYADDVISDLDLYLVPAGSFNTGQAIALSVGIDSTVEHIFFPIPTTGNYEIWIEQFDDDAGPQNYGLAWWYGLAPEIAVPVAGDFDGNGMVNAADLAQWEGDFGLNGDSDADNDNDSDGADFLAWQRNFGTGVPLSAATAAPEPASCLLVLMAMVLSPRRNVARTSQ